MVAGSPTCAQPLPPFPTFAPAQAVQDVADSGRCCVLDIDVQGARQVCTEHTRTLLTVGVAQCCLPSRLPGWTPHCTSRAAPSSRPVPSCDTCWLSHAAQACSQLASVANLQPEITAPHAALPPQVRKAPLKAIFVFIAPPSLEELEHRLRGRATGACALGGCCLALF